MGSRALGDEARLNRDLTRSRKKIFPEVAPKSSIRTQLLPYIQRI